MEGCLSKAAGQWTRVPPQVRGAHGRCLALPYDLEAMGDFDSATGVAVVGAGPYGLSLAAHLDHRRLENGLFGKTMRTWQTLLPTMGLKSHDFATNIYVPESGNRFVEYCRSHGRDLSEPIPFKLLAEYGLWVQRRLVAQVEESQVTRITAAPGGFGVQL